MAPVYVVSVHNVTDPEMLGRYVSAAGALPTRAEAELVAADSAVRTLEGTPRSRVAILKFADEAAARRWYDSEEYQKIRPLWRDSTSDGWAGLVTAVAD